MSASPQLFFLRKRLLPIVAAVVLGASPLIVAAPAEAVVEPTPTATPTPEPTAPIAAGPEASPAVDIASPIRVAADPATVEEVARYLRVELSDAGLVIGSFPDGAGGVTEFVDYGRSLDSALGLLAAGTQDDTVGRTLKSVEQTGAVGEYTQGAGFGDRPDAAYVGATAKLAFVVELTGGDATSAGGVNLLSRLLSLAEDDGRFADRSDFGNFANLFGHAFALLALDTAGRTPAPALVQGLLDTQCPDGSFPESYEPAEGATCTGSVDATGLVLQALAALELGSGEPAQQAGQWLLGQQRTDGSFPGQAPVNSTGYAVLGLNAVGLPSGDAVSYLVSQQNQDLGLRRGAGDDTSSDLFATAQALPALAGTTFQESGRVITRRDPFVAIAPPTHGDVFTQPPASPSPVASPIPSLVTAVGSDLPITGADTDDGLLLGVVLVAVGGLILAAARPRRRGRHAA